MRKISAIVAVSENGVIGQDNRLMWHLPNDLKHFKAKTLNKSIVMGRKTYESIGRPLPQRRNIVLSSKQNLILPGCEVMHSVDEILTATNHESELMITGGGEIYRLFMPYVNYLYITYVQVKLKGETTFPALDNNAWQEVSREKHEADPLHLYAYTFVELQKTK